MYVHDQGSSFGSWKKLKVQGSYFFPLLQLSTLNQRIFFRRPFAEVCWIVSKVMVVSCDATCCQATYCGLLSFHTISLTKPPHSYLSLDSCLSMPATECCFLFCGTRRRELGSLLWLYNALGVQVATSGGVRSCSGSDREYSSSTLGCWKDRDEWIMRYAALILVEVCLHLSSSCVEPNNGAMLNVLVGNGYAACCHLANQVQWYALSYR